MIACRRVDRPDGAVLSVLHGACFPDDAWDVEAMRQVLAMPGAFGFLASDDAARPAGFVLAQALVGQCEVLALGVVAAARRRGIARLLLARLLDDADRARQTVFLEVAEDNTAARALYAAAGFTEVGRRPAYYKRLDGSVVAAWQLRRDFAEG